jgi:UDP-glucose 4-epimerase
VISPFPPNASRRGSAAGGVRARTALVTGGAGFIGSRLVHSLCEQGWRVVVVDDLSSGWRESVDDRAHLHLADVGARAVLEDVIQAELDGGGRLDAVIHLAAKVGVRRVLADPEGCRESNHAAADELVRALAPLDQRHRPLLLSASTSEVYCEKRGPLHESDAVRLGHGAGRWAYAGSKLEAERKLDHGLANWGPDHRPLHLRFFNVVGPGQDADSGMVLPRFVEQAENGIPLTVHGDGSQVRTFAHVDEIVHALCALLNRSSIHASAIKTRLNSVESGRPGGPLNLGGSARASILDLAQMVLRVSGASTGIEHVDPLRSLSRSFEEVMYREPCLDRADSLGLPACERDLESIVRDTVTRHRRLQRGIQTAAR